MKFISFINENIIWSAPVFIMFIAAGVYITAKTGLIQFRGFLPFMKSLLSDNGKEKSGIKSVSSRQALCTALGGCVGTGNITGVVIALCTGGPGAVFWMWFSSFFGMSIKYAEIVLGVHYREKITDGEFCGGPMYTIKNGLRRRYYPLSYIFSISGVAASFGIGNIVQSNTAADSIKAFSEYADITNYSWIILLLSAVVLYFVLGRGAVGTGRLSGVIVPVMSFAYLLFCVIVICVNIKNVPEVISVIIEKAFSPDAFIGGSLGSAVSVGVRRGVFSNEAGLGSSALSHSNANNPDESSEGLSGLAEVFIDTILMCTVTAVCVLSANIPVAEESASMAVSAAWSTVFPEKLSYAVNTVCVFLFAFSSVVTWGLYGIQCLGYIFGDKYRKAYIFVFSAVLFAGVFVKAPFAWILSDTFNALMMLPNMVSVLLLSDKVKALTACNEALHIFRRKESACRCLQEARESNSGFLSPSHR